MTVLLSHDFSTLAEVASRFKTSIHDLLMWGADGKLQLSIRLKPDSLIEKIDLECSVCGSKKTVPEETGDVYPLSVTTLKALWGDEHKKFHPKLRCDCSEDLSVKCQLDASDPSFSEDQDGYKYDVKDLLVGLNDWERFKTDYPEFNEPQPSASLLADNQQANDDAKEVFPGDPGEKAKDGYKGIGEHFTKNPDTIRKRWAKEDGFPLNRSEGGRVYAYPTRLNSWRDGRVINKK